jgi:NADH-quinone oxidoreductase subunit C
VAIEPEAASHPAVQKLQAAFPTALIDARVSNDELTIEVTPAAARVCLEWLRGAEGFRFSLLSDLTAVDRFPVEPRFEVVYQLLSIDTRQYLRVKARVPGDSPAIDSVVSLWPAANMLKREVFDLFGIHFKDHPNLRRIMMPDEWEGHPLRKDYSLEGPR